ncbi:MAG: hypothetical protein SGI83_11040 [Bacteroidota bacterium]|nr:hypothetical protein [Bacteroidota bacterium]
MKTILFVGGLFFSLASFAQKGDELLVYSMKGTASVIEDKKESKLKIGKVLKPGSVIKTQPQAKLTLVCKQGKALSVTKAGTFPVTKWKDSCYSSSALTSVTTKYFRYIWDQLYVRSDDYKNQHNDNNVGAVERDDAPVRGDKLLEIEFVEGMDSINYAGGSFRLSWETSIPYTGRYNFLLIDKQNGKTVYEDSVTGKTQQLDSLVKYMKAGRTYYWYLATPSTGISQGGVIKYILLRRVNQQVGKLQKSVNVPEGQAAQYFRIAYLLEQTCYPADALRYYQKAVTAAPEEAIYQDKLSEFKKIFQLETR